MDRHIGIVIGRDGALAGVALVRQGAAITLDASILHAAGRVFTPGELAKVLRMEQSDRIAVGSYFEHVALLDLLIPPELSSEEALGVAQFQLAGQIPVPISEMVCHMRRIDVGDGSRVRVAAITVDNWMQPINTLTVAGIEADMVTSPLLAGDCGIEGDKWIVPEFEPEFAFSPTGIVMTEGEKPVWTPEMDALIEQANTKKVGIGREKLFPAAIQMALLSLKNPPLLFESINMVLPKELKPKRHTGLKFLLMLLLFLAGGLAVGIGGRWYLGHRYNNQVIAQFNAQADVQIKKLENEINDMNYAVKMSEDGFKALGKSNHIFRLISRLSKAIPEDFYVQTIRTQSDGSVLLTISGDEDNGELRRGLDSMDPQHFRVADMPNETVRGTTVHRATIMLLGD